MDKEIIEKIEKAAIKMRKKALKLALTAGRKGAHLGGGLSLIEIMAVLYLGIMNIKKDFNWINRDRLILSKGHGVLAFYTALYEAGLLTESELEIFEENESILPGHPVLNIEKGIEMSAGSLGIGLSFGIGIAMAAKMDKKSYKTYVILGDGECNEGNIWEAAMSASHFMLNNIIAIIDSNKLQYDGENSSIMNIESLKSKWESFGWNVKEVNGHNIYELFEALNSKNEEEKPLVIIANTIKGKGVSFMENKREWHHGILTQKQYEEAIEALGGES